MGSSSIVSTPLQLYWQRTDWGLALTGFGRPFGLGYDQQGRLLVTDMDCHVVVRWDLNQQSYQCHHGIQECWGPAIDAIHGHSSARPQRQPVGWNGPHSAACDASGNNLIVACYYAPAIVNVPSEDAASLLVGPDRLSGPASATLDRQGRLLVAEYAKNLVMLFDPTGRYLGRLGCEAGAQALRFDPSYAAVPASKLPGGFDRLHMAFSAQDDCLLVADTWNNRIQKFSPSGDYLCLLDDTSGWKSAPDRRFWKRNARHSAIPCPVAIDQDTKGRILVTAWGSGQLFLLESDGCGTELPVPTTLCKPYDARFYKKGVVIADTHNGRVLVVENILNG